MKNNTINLVPSGHEVGIVTMVSGEILASFFISFYTSKNNFKKFLPSGTFCVSDLGVSMEGHYNMLLSPQLRRQHRNSFEMPHF